MKYYITIIGISLLSILSACKSDSDKKMDVAFAYAKENKRELKKVLSHYKNDALKLNAAMFLIENMPGHYSVSEETIALMQPIYNKHQQISEKYKWQKSTAWGKEIDSLKDYSAFPSPRYIKDITHLKGDWLIKHIDLSFDIWKNNAYTKHLSFSDFCTYILPYRLTNGILLDDGRGEIYNQHKNLIHEKKQLLTSVIDSILMLHQDVEYNEMYGASIPLYSFETLEQIKRVKCSDKCWYNEILLNSLGFPVVTDYVPNWGNRNNSHSWNALVMGDSVYPFSALWEKEWIDRWKYKELYKNKEADLLWGKFRLSKVYRNTYSFHPTGPITDTEVEIEHIPSIFKNPWMQDVSHQYFDTTNINLPISNRISSDIKYGYLCTYDYQKWTPVQWGKRIDNHISFYGMGRDVLYLPTYYQKDKEQYLGSPIWLKSNGEVQFLQKQKELDTIYIKQTEGMWLKQKIDTDRSYFAGLTIIAMNNQTKAHDTLCIIDEFPNMEMNTIQIKKNIYKQIKLITQADTLAFNKIRFNGLNGIIPAQIVSCSGKLIQEKGLDGHSETSLMSVRRKKDEQHTIHIELENENELASISFYPYTSNLLDPQSEYELFYWNNGWQSFGIKKGNVDFLVWHNVPKGCLYLLKNKSKKFNSGEPLLRLSFLLILMLTGLVEAIWGMQQLHGYTGSNHSLFRLTGTFFNPGPYSGYLAVILPVCLWMVLRFRLLFHYFAWICVVAIAVVLPAGMSRSAWIATVVACGWVYGAESWRASAC